MSKRPENKLRWMNMSSAVCVSAYEYQPLMSFFASGRVDVGTRAGAGADAIEDRDSSEPPRSEAEHSSSDASVEEGVPMPALLVRVRAGDDGGDADEFHDGELQGTGGAWHRGNLRAAVQLGTAGTCAQHSAGCPAGSAWTSMLFPISRCSNATVGAMPNCRPRRNRRLCLIPIQALIRRASRVWCLGVARVTMTCAKVGISSQSIRSPSSNRTALCARPPQLE